MTQNGSQESGLVAVIGLGCVLPDANSPDEYWENLRRGRSSIREVPPERWDPALYYSADRTAPDKTYSKIGAFVTGFRFDARQFRIPPSVVKSLDDSQLWALHAAAQALADAGYDKKPFDRTRCAVILGNAMGGEVRMMTGMRIMFPEFRRALEEAPGFQALSAEARQRVLSDAEAGFKRAMPEITEDTMPGELSNVIAGRVANLLNLTGKNFTTDAACASSLAAIDAAIRALAHRECDLVLTGGVDRSMDVGSYVKFCKIGALSAHGSFPFDARADGFVMGEGAGMLLLKRLEDAVRDGDKVYAVIRGVGSSSDGKGKGITAPNIEGQVSCVTRALKDAHVTPGEVDLIECHGTSTKVGDVVEVQALTQIFGPHVAKKQSIPIGSVKSNLGHLKSAAGGASLLKIALALHHKVLPPSINYETPNPNLRIEETPFFVNATARPWPEPPAGRPRRASISSFGFGGTNFHVVLEEYAPGKNLPKVQATTVAEGPAKAPASTTPIASLLLKSTPKTRPAEPPMASAKTDVLVVGAATATDLVPEIARVQERVRAVTQRNFQAFCREQSAAALARPVRVALVVESPTDAADKLAKAQDGVLDQKRRALVANQGIHFGEGQLHGKVAFLFPGQGSQYADMLRDLATRFTAAKRTLDDADRVMEPLVGKPLTSFLFSDEAADHTKEKVEEQLKRTEITQPAVLAADAAIFRLLRDYGVKPDLVAGHSLGEYGALTAAGVLTFDDALLAVSARGREMANVHVPDLGKMASVTADTATVEAKLKAVPGYVIPANKNCKVQTVIAGASSAVDAAVKMFQAQGIAAQFIPVSAAFHSSIVAPASEPMKKVLGGLDVREPKIPVLSNVHADYYPRGATSREAIIDLLGRQVAAPVEWQKQVERMYADGARVFVEVGPKTVLTTFVKNILEDKPHAAIGTNHPKKGGFFHFFDTIAFLAAHGYPVQLPRPDDANILLPSFRETIQVPTATSPVATAPAPVHAAPPPSTAAAGVTGLAFPDLERHAQAFIREKQEELRRALEGQIRQLQPAKAPSSVEAVAADAELLAFKKRVDALGINLEPVLMTGVSVGTPGTTKKLFDDSNIERVFRGENAIDTLSPDEQRKQLEKNVVRLVKSSTGDHRFETIRDVAEVIKLAGKKGEFDFQKDYGINQDFAEALDITSKMAIAAGIEALKDAQIPLVRGYVKTTTGKFLPGEWALPEPLQHETGVIFASVWPGVPKIVDYVSQHVANQYMRKSAEERRALYRDLAAQMRDPAARREIEAWSQRHEADIEATGPRFYEFNRRFLFHVLGMGHSQLAQFIRAKGPNTAVQAACATTTQAVGIAEDWIRMGRCRRVLIVGADDITGPEMLEYWAAGFLAAGAATTEGDVTKAALPFDRRRHGMIIGMGAVGLVIEAESAVRERGMEGITEIIATSFLNSAYHGSRLDTEHVAKVMDDLFATVEKRTGTPRGQIARGLLFMSHETYTPARGGSAAAEIEALTKTFGADVSKVVVANTKGFTGHPMAVGVEDAIAVRCLQLGRVPPIANLREPDPSLGNIQLSRGGHYDLEYGLRLGAGFGSQIAMYVVKLRSKDLKRILDPAKYQAWLSRVAGTKNPELEVVNRTLRIKAQLPALVEAPVAAATPVVAPVAPAPVAPRPVPVPMPAVAAHTGKPTQAEALARIIDVVAEKTGYPNEMLEPDLDLEADLGIDTVKQAELFGILREQYGIARDDTIQLKDYNTLNKLAAFVVQRLATPQTEAAVETAVASTPEAATASEPATEKTTRRYVVRYVSVASDGSQTSVFENKTFVVWAPGHHRADLVYAMKRSGSTGLSLDALPTRYEEAKAWVDQQRSRSPRIHGLLFVPAANPGGSEFSVEDARVAKSLFYLVKAILSTGKSGEFETLGVATFLGGDFANHLTGPLNPIEGALVGIAKAVAREIPNATVKAVDFPPSVPPPVLAQALLEELGRRDGIVEVGTHAGRGTLRLLEEETAEEEPGVELQANDVVLVSGGGTGITSDIVQRLARAAPATFVLLGRTPLHADAGRYAGMSEQEWNGKRIEVQAELKARGEKVTPVAVDRALAPLRKSAEIHATLEAVRRAGAKVEYHAVDVTDTKSVEQLLRALRATTGPVTGILHAAGIEESKLIVDKTSESFDRVYDVKVLGARNLIAATRSDPVRFFLGFSSIAGRFGNAGQADYSAANDALAKLCAALRVERGATFAATAIDWSAWADKGMATRGSVMTVLREAGVRPIPLAEGVRRCVDELLHGCRDAEILVAGELGRLATADAFTEKEAVVHVPTRPAPTAPPQPRSSGDQVLLVEEAPAAPHGNLITRTISSDGRTATATLLLDPKEPYLNDHRVDGVPYLAGVLGQEAMAEVAATLAPGKRFAGSRDMEFRVPVKVLREQPLEVSIVASIAHDSDERAEIGCRLQSVFVNAKGERLGAPRIHFTGTMVFETAAPAPGAYEEPSADLEGRIIEKTEIYEHYFHGPSFRVLNTVGFEANASTTIGVWADPRAPLFRGRPAQFLTNPMMRELAYQTAGAFELFKNRFLALPKGEGRLRYYRDAEPGTAARAVAKLREVEGQVAHFDVTVATTEGELLFELEDFQLIRLRPVEAANGAPAASSAPSVYRSRWGHDVPMPLPGTVAVRVELAEVEAAGVSAQESLTSGERADQERYRNDKRAREFFLGRLAAKEALATLIGRPVREARGIEIRRLETGEPQSRGAGLEGTIVSITHSGTTAVAAAARRGPQLLSIGVDAEVVEPKAPAFESEAFTDEERSLLDRLEGEGRPRAESLIRFWAVKEAVLKALGKGFALDVRDVQIQHLDGDERVQVRLRPAAERVLAEMGAAKVSVQTWLRDGLAYALAWTHN